MANWQRSKEISVAYQDAVSSCDALAYHLLERSTGEADLPIKDKILVGLLPLALLAGCGEEKIASKAKSDDIHTVQVVTVQQENLQRTVNAVGTIRYRRETPLGFTTAGKVATVRF